MKSLMERTGYHVEEMLGQGTFGMAWLVRRGNPFGTRIVIKTQTKPQDFIREARLSCSNSSVVERSCETSFLGQRCHMHFRPSEELQLVGRRSHYSYFHTSRSPRSR